MPIDDRLEKALGFYSEELETDVPKKVVSTVIGQIPHYGSEINKLIFGDAQRRVAERAKDVFEAVKERLEHIEESAIDKNFLKSDEFMTILILAIEQLQTTHDKQKMQMLATAIANSGMVGFSRNSRKELFLLIFRDLAPEHLEMLRSMKPRLKDCLAGVKPLIKKPQGADLAVLQVLAGQGLVDESQELEERPRISPTRLRSESQISSALGKLLMLPRVRRFQLNAFGEDFLSFFDSQV